jgi:hypothetical protein
MLLKTGSESPKGTSFSAPICAASVDRMPVADEDVPPKCLFVER